MNEENAAGGTKNGTLPTNWKLHYLLVRFFTNMKTENILLRVWALKILHCHLTWNIYLVVVSAATIIENNWKHSCSSQSNQKWYTAITITTLLCSADSKTSRISTRIQLHTWRHPMLQVKCLGKALILAVSHVHLIQSLQVTLDYHEPDRECVNEGLAKMFLSKGQPCTLWSHFMVSRY